MTEIIQMPYQIMRAINCDWDIDWRSQSSGEGTDGVEQIFLNPFPRWIGSPSLALYGDLVKDWRAVRAKLRGRVNVLRVPLVDYDDLPDAYGTDSRAINGTGLGDGPTVSVVSVAGAGANSVVVSRGLYPILVGSFISIKDWPYAVVDVEQGSNAQRVYIEMPLRRAVAQDDVVNLRAHGLFKATEDAMGLINVGANGFTQVDLTLREWIGPGRA